MNRIADLAALGVDVWVRREAPGNAEAPPGCADESRDLDALAARVAGCSRCDLHATRTQTVFGIGDRNADLLIIGEAPGAEEDRRGEPFVGRAGQLLNSMLNAIGIARERAYIANILKCRPPDNRDPRPEEVAACGDYLARQIALVAPRVILVLGRIAAQNLLNESTPIGKMRGQRYTYGAAQVPVIVTYHPAYLLRSPQEKRKSWQDLLHVKTLIEEPRT
jgi:DNA polymerase